MRFTRPLWVALASAVCVSGSEAQVALRPAFAAGTGWGFQDMHLDGSVTLSSPNRKTQLRTEVYIGAPDALVLASLIIPRGTSGVQPYLVGSFGVAMDRGPHFPAWALGLGVRSRELVSAPVFLELRMISDGGTGRIIGSFGFELTRPERR